MVNWLLAFLPGIGIAVGATSITAFVVNAVNACTCNIFHWGYPAFIFGVACGVVGGFSAKRNRLLGSDMDGRLLQSPGSGENVYAREEELLKAVGSRRGTEIQLDVVGWFLVAGLIYLTPTAAAVFIHDDRHLTPKVSPTHEALIVVLAAILIAGRSIRRKWAWRPSTRGPSQTLAAARQ